MGVSCNISSVHVPVLPSKIHKILDLESHVALMEMDSGLGTYVTSTHVPPPRLRNKILLKLSKPPCVPHS